MTEIASIGVIPEVAQWADALTSIRREIHQFPEVRFETTQTVARLMRLLSGWGINDLDATSVNGGLIAVVNGNRPGATIALRADIDALPMKDLSETAWSSRNAGCAHACGHDGHQTWLLGALRYLQQHNDFPGRVVGIFQPCEEYGEGALAVVNAGILTRYDVKEIYGAHTEPNLPKGTIGLKEGPLQASVDTWWVEIDGVGTHGGRPHLGVDPITVGAQIVNALQTIVSRRVNPIESAVVSVCSINAGSFDATNIIPQRLTMSGTCRLFEPHVRDLVEDNFKRIVCGVAQANGCKANVRYERQSPAVINDIALTREVARIVSERFGAQAANTGISAMLSSEDFSVYQQHIPGVMMRIGIRDEAHTTALHHPAFDFNDEVLPMAVSVFVAVATQRLAALA